MRETAASFLHHHNSSQIAQQSNQMTWCAANKQRPISLLDMFWECNNFEIQGIVSYSTCGYSCDGSMVLQSMGESEMHNSMDLHS